MTISKEMLYLPTLISIIEVLLVTVPVLLTVAYVTVAERKTMASMQRRLGPNIVGQLKFNTSFKRSYHVSNNNNIISELYLNAQGKPLSALSRRNCKCL